MKISHCYRLLLALTVVAGVGCQSAQHSGAMLPAAQANAPALLAAAAPAPAPAAEEKPVPAAVPQPEPKPDPVADLIARVEKEYQAGQQNYSAGHLEAAKQNFDHAFDLLLASPAEMRSDERFKTEFDKILDG